MVPGTGVGVCVQTEETPLTEDLASWLHIMMAHPLTRPKSLENQELWLPCVDPTASTHLRLSLDGGHTQHVFAE